MFRSTGKDPAQPEPQTGPSLPYEIRELCNYKRFRKHFVHRIRLGFGSDGTVDAYQHKASGQLIAVKTPHSSTSRQLKPCKALLKEIHNFRELGQHPHIVSMVTYSCNYRPRAPAVFLTLCELGDLDSYRQLLLHYQREQGLFGRIPETTVWKLLHDMSLALDHLHNRTGPGSGFVHSDIKPGNILVTYPAGWDPSDGVPPEPIFQLADLSRMKRYPAPADQTSSFIGTPEYAPPADEQDTPRPSSDMWSLGATLQSLALGIVPTQSRESYTASYAQHTPPPPRPDDDAAWTAPAWRRKLPTLFRPVSASHAELVQNHDFKTSLRIVRGDTDEEQQHAPYSTALDAWYAALWARGEHRRVEARMLVRYQVPRVEADMAVARDLEAARRCAERAARLRRRVEGRRLKGTRRGRARA